MQVSATKLNVQVSAIKTCSASPVFVSNIGQQSWMLCVEQIVVTVLSHVRDCR